MNFFLNQPLKVNNLKFVLKEQTFGKFLKFNLCHRLRLICIFLLLFFLFCSFPKLLPQLLPLSCHCYHHHPQHHQMSMSEKIEIDFLLFCCVQFNAAVSISVRSNTMSIRFIAITQLLLFEKH